MNSYAQAKRWTSLRGAWVGAVAQEGARRSTEERHSTGVRVTQTAVVAD